MNLKKTVIITLILFIFLQILSLPSKTFIKSQITNFYGNSSFLDKNYGGKNNLFFIDFFSNSKSLNHYFNFSMNSGLLTFFIFLILICGVIGSYKERDEKILPSFFKNISIFWWKALILFVLYLPIFLFFSMFSFYLTKTILKNVPSMGKILPLIYGAISGFTFILFVKFFYMASKVSLIALDLKIFKAFIYPFKNIKKVLKKLFLPFLFYVILIGILNILLIYLLSHGITNTLIYILIEILIFLKLLTLTSIYGVFEGKIEIME